MSWTIKCNKNDIPNTLFDQKAEAILAAKKHEQNNSGHIVKLLKFRDEFH